MTRFKLFLRRTHDIEAIKLGIPPPKWLGYNYFLFSLGVWECMNYIFWNNIGCKCLHQARGTFGFKTQATKCIKLNIDHNQLRIALAKFHWWSSLLDLVRTCEIYDPGIFGLDIDPMTHFLIIFKDI